MMNEVIIRLGIGRLVTGFESVTIELKQDDRPQWEERVSLSVAPNLMDSLNRWQLLYPLALNIDGETIARSPSQTVLFDDSAIGNFSSQDLASIEDNLRRELNTWLATGDFGKAIRRLRTALDRQAEITVIIVSELEEIWQLPWHFWDLFEDYQRAIEVFAHPKVQQAERTPDRLKSHVNILGVFGRDPQLELQPNFLDCLPQVCIKKLGIRYATSALNIADSLDGKPWDIFIFNGHGDTQTGDRLGTTAGIIYLDNDTPIEISRLQQRLANAVERGLQIAIFNCCLGLGLAAQLGDANIPYLVVMREKIPDRLAQQFLEDLLHRYSSGDRFTDAFKYARSRLILADSNFAKYANWLPVLFHNPLSRDARWTELYRSNFDLPIAPAIIKLCTDFSQSRRRIWMNVGVSLGASLLALSCQYTLAISTLERQILDPVQAMQAANANPSKITLVNYKGISIGGLSNSTDDLAAQIDRLSQKYRPSLWIIDLEFDRDDKKLFDRSDVVRGCTDLNRDINSQIYHRSELSCHPKTIGFHELQSQPYFQNISVQGLRLNYHLLPKINSIDIDETIALTDSRAQQLFQDKIIIVGTSPGDEIGFALRDALALDLSTRNLDPRQRLPLFAPWQIGLAFIWIFFWSMIMAIVAWRQRSKLWLIGVVVVQIIITGLLLIGSQGVPIVMPTISMLIVGTIIASIRSIARRRIPVR